MKCLHAAHCGGLARGVGWRLYWDPASVSKNYSEAGVESDLADGDSRGSQHARGSHNDARGDPEEAAHVDGADSEGPVIEVDRRP